MYGNGKSGLNESHELAQQPKDEIFDDSMSLLLNYEYESVTFQKIVGNP